MTTAPVRSVGVRVVVFACLLMLLGDEMLRPFAPRLPIAEARCAGASAAGTTAPGGPGSGETTGGGSTPTRSIDSGGKKKK